MNEPYNMSIHLGVNFMDRRLPTPSNSSTVRTYYKYPILDRITGRYTVEWIADGKSETLRAHTRLTDYEGNRPSLRSILTIPYIIKTYISAKRYPFLDRPVPRLVVEAITFLSTILTPGMRVLEIGGGNSTLWFLQQNVNLLTIEHLSGWADLIQHHINSHADIYQNKQFKLEIEHGEDAISLIQNLPDRSFDVVLVDSMNRYISRNQCVQASRSKVREGGWLILDNSDFPEHWGGVDLMQDRERIRFVGYQPIGLNVSQTSFWKM